jgi:hypothetical protein
MSESASHSRMGVCAYSAPKTEQFARVNNSVIIKSKQENGSRFEKEKTFKKWPYLEWRG